MQYFKKSLKPNKTLELINFLAKIYSSIQPLYDTLNLRTDMAAEEKFQVDKVHNKIPTWFKVDKQHQINSRILLRFLELHSKNTYVCKHQVNPILKSKQLMLR